MLRTAPRFPLVPYTTLFRSDNPSLPERLREQIRLSGPITFHDWMNAALYDEAGGYYKRSDLKRWGREGDYRTSPSVANSSPRLSLVTSPGSTTNSSNLRNGPSSRPAAGAVTLKPACCERCENSFRRFLVQRVISRLKRARNWTNYRRSNPESSFQTSSSTRFRFIV